MILLYIKSEFNRRVYLIITTKIQFVIKNFRMYLHLYKEEYKVYKILELIIH